MLFVSKNCAMAQFQMLCNDQVLHLFNTVSEHIPQAKMHLQALLAIHQVFLMLVCCSRVLVGNLMQVDHLSSLKQYQMTAISKTGCYQNLRRQPWLRQRASRFETPPPVYLHIYSRTYFYFRSGTTLNPIHSTKCSERYILACKH